MQEEAKRISVYEAALLLKEAEDCHILDVGAFPIDLYHRREMKQGGEPSAYLLRSEVEEYIKANISNSDED